MVIGDNPPGGSRLDQAFSRIEGMFKESAGAVTAHEKRLEKLELTAIAKEDLSDLRGQMYEHVGQMLKDNTEQVVGKYEDKLVNARQAILADVDKLGAELHKTVTEGIKEAFAQFENERMKAIVEAKIEAIEEARREYRNTQVMRWRNRLLLATAFVGLAFSTWQAVQARNENAKLKSAYDISQNLDKAGRAIQP